MNGSMHSKTPKVPRVSLNAFAEFVGCGAGGRLDCVNRQIENYSAEYRPGADFYKDFCDAVREGRSTNADELSLRRCLSRQSLDVRRRHYEDLMSHWLKMRKWHLPPVQVGRSSWSLPELRIGVSPHLGLQLQDGRTAVVRFWLREAEPAKDAITAIQWLLNSNMPTLCPGGIPLVIDVRRERAYLLGKRPFRRGYEQALRAEAVYMATLWASQMKIA